MKVFLVVMLFVLAAPTIYAAMPDEVLHDPVLEQRARELTKELRCMVCQNQSIEESDAPLARDLRVLVREQLSAGRSEQEIRQFLVARYGDFVLLKPAFKPETYLLWLAPVLTFVAGLFFCIRWLRRQAGGVSS